MRCVHTKQVVPGLAQGLAPDLAPGLAPGAMCVRRLPQELGTNHTCMDRHVRLPGRLLVPGRTFVAQWLLAPGACLKFAVAPGAMMRTWRTLSSSPSRQWVSRAVCTCNAHTQRAVEQVSARITLKSGRKNGRRVRGLVRDPRVTTGHDPETTHPRDLSPGTICHDPETTHLIVLNLYKDHVDKNHVDKNHVDTHHRLCFNNNKHNS